MDYSKLDMSKEIKKAFCSLMADQGLSPVEALDFLDYEIFIRHSDWFYSLSEEQQIEVRMVLHSIKLVHK